MTSTIQQSPETSFEEINRIFLLQQAHKQIAKNTTVADRIKKLDKIKQALFARRNDIKVAVNADFSKPLEEVDITEIYPLLIEIKTISNHLSTWMEEEQVESPISMFGSSAKIIKEPKGNCLLISPWNYPFQLAISPLLMAIASGNVCILKPSELTPSTSRFIKQFVASIFDEKEVAVIEGGQSTAEYLLSLKFDHIHFTGSPNVGKVVMKAASQHLCSVTLELGGKSPVIIDETADIENAASKVAWGKFLNCGQTCIAPDYVYVHESKAKLFIELVGKAIDKMYGKSIESDLAYGKIVNARHFNRLKTLLDKDLAAGAKIEIGGISDANSNYIAPTVVSNLSENAGLLHEEIFGPILPLITFKTLEEAAQKIAQQEKPLALYIFSNKRKNIDYLLQHTTAGGTCINDTVLHQAHPSLPFGGVNNSGIGKSHGIWGFREFTNERAVLTQHLKKGAAQMLYPPYTSFVKRIIDFTLKYF